MHYELITEFLKALTGSTIAEVWNKIPLAHRFGFTPWIMLLFMYAIFTYYEKANSLGYERNLEDRNFGGYIYWCFGVPYVIFLCAFFVGAAPVYKIYEHWFLSFLSVGLQLVGLWFVVMARARLNGAWGSAIYSYSDKNKKPKLVTSGLYSWVRHPIYFGQFLLIAGSVFALNDFILLASLLLCGIFAVIRAKKEEKDLASRFPVEFEAYKKQASFIVPKF